VDVGAAKLFGAHHFTGRRFHERRTAQENRSFPFDDDRFIAHRWHIRATRGARPHDCGDLRDAFARHARLIIKDPPEVVAIGEDVGLQR